MEEIITRADAMPRKRIRARRRGRSLTAAKLLEQRLMGAVLVLICVIATLLDGDATAAVLLAPLGLWMLFTKEIVIY